MSSVQQLLEKLCRKAGLADSAWLQPGAQLERTAWIHVLECPDREPGFVPLEALRSTMTPPAVMPATLHRAIQLSLARLLATQKDDGSLGYRYNPFKDRWVSSTNHVRLAGCAYALARLAYHPSDLATQTAKTGAERLIEFLLQRTDSIGTTNTLFVVEDDQRTVWGKLGATALTALALCHISPSRWEDKLAGLLNTILTLQRPDGSFNCFINHNAAPEVGQDFYPGESLLALAVYTQQRKDEHAAEAIGRSFPYYASRFRAHPTSAFVLWQTDAWARMALWRLHGSFPELGHQGPDLPAIIQFVFDQVDWIIHFQYQPGISERQERGGGFSFSSAPTYSTTCYVEALIRACDLAHALGDSVRLQQYRKAALLGLGFMLRLQVSPETAPFFPRPELAVGAITKSLTSFEMRCDYDQHFLTACLTALDSPALWTT